MTLMISDSGFAHQHLGFSIDLRLQGDFGNRNSIINVDSFYFEVIIFEPFKESTYTALGLTHVHCTPGPGQDTPLLACLAERLHQGFELRAELIIPAAHLSNHIRDAPPPPTHDHPIWVCHIRNIKIMLILIIAP